MKQFLIIPLGGLGTRFTKAGYKTYKPFLKISPNTRIIDNIVANFPSKQTKIIFICNEKKYEYIKKTFNRKNTTFIKIKNHKLGPIQSLYLARQELKNLIKNNKFFVSYSDINWKWNYNSSKNFLKNKKVVILSHTGFHPHLEINPKSDFFLSNKKEEVIKVSKKKTITENYQKNYLAIGCYYFKNFEYFEDYFNTKKIKERNKEKETYLIDFLNFCLKKKIKINHLKIEKFVHLGDPYQYENFILWKNTLGDNFIKSMKLKKYESVMLMAGKGRRVKNLKEKKPFLKIKNFKAFEYIFNKFGSNKKYIIFNKNSSNLISRKYLRIKIKRTNSMLQTIEKSLDYIKDLSKFFILSCDCVGSFEKKKFENFLKINNPDIVLFAFDISKIQKNMKNAHTTINLKKNTLISSIQVKKYLNKKKELGHAGFFWVKNSNIFQYLKKFIISNKINREILLDDYFKFLFDKKLCKVRCYKLKEYIHFGSITEYLELRYWIKYFDNENR